MGAGKSLSLQDERIVGGEPVADVLAQSCQLKGTEIGGDIIPRIIDELPVLAVAACFAEGTTVIRDAAELRFKETDRIQTTVSQLRRLGANIEAKEDGMVIHGTGRLSGAVCESYADHRLAMTGTPVENHVGELWSLFEFLNPGMLGRSSAFAAMAHRGSRIGVSTGSRLPSASVR